MKSIKRIGSLFLLAMSMAVVGCKGTDSALTADTYVPGSYKTQKETIHIGIDDVKDTPTVFAYNGKSDYKLVMGNRSDQFYVKLGGLLVSNVISATGVNLEYEDNPTFTSTAKYIVINDKDMFAAAGLTAPDIDLGVDGYYIKTVGNSIFVYASRDDGYRMGVLALMKYLIGYDYLHEDFVVYEKDGKLVTPTTTLYLPDCDIIEVPDYSYRYRSNIMRSGVTYNSGLTDNNIFISLNPANFHNSFWFLNPGTYGESHPEWFATTKSASTNMSQLCYSGRGDIETRKYMQEIITDKMMANIFADKYAGLENINFTQEDTKARCECDACEAISDEYGYSAVVVNFVNELDDMLQEKLEQKAKEEGTTKRTFNINFFAYQLTFDAPKKKDNYSTCHDSVGVIIAPSTAKWTHSMLDDVNEEQREGIIAWKPFTKRMIIWAYQTNFASYIYPFNTFDTVIENYRFFLDQNAIIMMNEGNWEDFDVSGFTKFKDYIDFNAEVNVNVNYFDLVEKFFKYYYGDAGEIMRQFYDEVVDYLHYLEVAFEGEITGHMNRETYAYSKYWPLGTLKRWRNMVLEAFDSVAPLQYTNLPLYEKVYKHIQLDGLFPSYALATLYASSFSQEELQELREEIVAACTNNAVKHHREHAEGTLQDTLFAEWGF